MTDGRPHGKPHDALARRTFARPDVAGPYLASVLPGELVEALDLRAPVLEPGSFLDADLKERVTDLLFRVSVRGLDEEVFLYVLVEPQSKVERLMALRLFVYLGRIWDQWRRAHPKARRVPAILPLVLYNGRARWSAPTELEELFSLAPDALASIRPRLPALRYQVDDLRRRSDAEQARPGLPSLGTVTLLLLRHGADAREPFLVFLRALSPRLNALEDRDDLRATFSYIFQVAKAETEEVIDALRSGLAPDVQEVAVTAADQLRKEGLDQGLLEGQRRVLLRLLRGAFQLTPELEERVAQATQAQLDRWADRVLKAKTLEDVFAD